MRTIALFILTLITGNAFAAPGIREALKAPSTITILQFSGEKDEAALFLKNAFRFTALTQVNLCGITDSITAEQDLASIAACTSVVKIAFEKCGFAHLSPAVKMLVSVKEVEIINCSKLSADDAFSCLFGMPALKNISYSTDKLVRMPRSFRQLRGLQRISISNNDLSLADGYALNNSNPQSLYATEKLQLGFAPSVLALEYSCYDKATAKEHVSIMRDMLQGAAGMSDEVVLPQRGAGFTRINPLVAPPILGLDVRKSIYTTDATNGGLVEYPSGTKIIFPAHAFVDAAGNDVKGNVTIDYREFRDPVDILVSGIPMVYDSAGVAGDFESAGMFELNASVNGNEVFLAPGKKADIEFAVVDTASTFNFYRLDPVKGWVYESTPGVTEKKYSGETVKEPFSLTNAVAIYKMKTLNMLKKRPAIGDTVGFDARYADTNYVYMHKMTRTNFNQQTRKRQLRNVAEWKLRKVSARKGHTCFMLNRTVEHQSINNPEMQAFSGVLWETANPMESKQFREYFGRTAGITDVRLEYNGGSDFIMELKYLWGFRRIAVTPVKIYDRTPEAYSAKICAQRFKNYARALNRRKAKLQREKTKTLYKLRAWQRAASIDSLKSWKEVNNVMNEEEQPMQYNSWVAYTRTQMLRQDSVDGHNYSQVSAVYQALSVEGFGIYNCDQIRRIQNPVEVFALALSPDGKAKSTTTFFVVDKKRNMVFSYSGKIIYGKNAHNTLLAVGNDGSLSYTNETEFTRMQRMSAGAVGFPSTEVSTTPVSTAELRSIMFPAE